MPRRVAKRPAAARGSKDAPEDGVPVAFCAGFPVHTDVGVLTGCTSTVAPRVRSGLRREFER